MAEIDGEERGVEERDDTGALRTEAESARLVSASVYVKLILATVRPPSATCVAATVATALLPRSSLALTTPTKLSILRRRLGAFAARVAPSTASMVHVPDGF